MLLIKIMLLIVKCIFKSRLLKYGEKLGMEAHTFESRHSRAEAGRSRVQGQSGLHTHTEALS